MNGNIVGEEFEDYVFEQIAQRQKNQFSGYTEFRTPQQIQYLNNTSAWVKLASGMEINEEDGGVERLRSIIEDENLANQFLGSDLAKKTILFNGTSETTPAVYNEGKKVEKLAEYNLRAGYSKSQNIWNLSTAYGLGGPEFGQQPMPGIQSVDVKSLNRGSIREANVTIKAYNKYQFAIIELLYLRIGFSMMLEWGNDKYINNQGEFKPTENTIIEDLWFQNNDYTQLKMINDIERYRGIYNGNYDGFFGKVANFDWTFLPDGSYDINLKLITVGDVIESLQANIPVNSVQARTVDLKLEEKNNIYKDLNDSPLVNAAKNNKLGKYLFESLTQNDLWETESNPEYFSFKYIEDDNQFLKKIPTNYQYYMTFGKLLNIFQNEIIPTIKNENSIFSMLDIEKDEFSNKISYYPNQISLDPRICIFKYYFGGGDDPNYQIQGLESPSYLNSLKEYITFADQGIVYGRLMNIYLNYDFISKSLTANTKDGKLSIYKFFERICDGINSALGNVNNIEPIIKDDKIITFIDQNPIPGYLETIEPKNSIVDLEVYGYNNSKSTANFLKNINFKTSITPQLASMITIGTTAGGSATKNEDGTAFSNWNKGLKDRFAQRRIDPKDKVTEQERNKKARVKELIIEFDNKSTPQFLGFLRADDKTDEDEYKSFTNSKYKRKRRSITTAFIRDQVSVKEFIIAALKNDELLNATPDLISQEEYTTEKQTNYMLYLTTAFGGKTNIKIQTRKKTAGGSIPTIVEATPTEIFQANYLKFEPDFISQGKNTFKTYVNVLSAQTYQEQKSPSNQIGFIPVGFDITLQGISGIKIYNKLNINNTFLPAQYPKALKFLIQKVNHSIKDNTWETTLDTLSIPKVEKVSNKDVDRFFAEIQLQTILLPAEERGPKPTNEPLLIYDGRNSTPYTTPISVEDLLKEFNSDAVNTFRKFFTDLERNYKGYKININAIGRSIEKSEELLQQNPNNAKPGTSRHNFFAAVDFNVITPNNLTLKKKGNKYAWINHGFDKLAERYNIIWGGFIDGYEDCVHFGLEFQIPQITSADLKGNNGKNINLT